ncbi:MAG: efflux RND transporter periplasmic adaptor subunit [Phycisphaerales bacterium]
MHRTALGLIALVGLGGVGLAGLTIAGAVGGCAKKAEGAPPPATPPQPPQVAVVKVESKTVPVTYRFIGMTEPTKTVEIRSRIAGFLLSRSFTEGTPIKAGELLFTIDPRPFEADLEITRAAPRKPRRKSASPSRSCAATPKRQRPAPRHGRTSIAQTAVTSAHAAVNLANAEVRKSELDLSYTKIMSPVTGLIGKALKDEGSYLDSGNNGLLAVATQTDPMYVTFSVPERDWLRWREQAQSGEIRPSYTNPDGSPIDLEHPHPPVRISLLDGTEYPKEGRLTFFDTKIDAGTGSAVARATMPNADAQLKAGLFVHATIIGWERPNSIVVPQRSVVNNSGGSFVYVVSAESKVEMHKVTLGEWNGDGWLILSGLTPGETVIADGFAKAPPGTQVTTIPYKPQPAPGKSGEKPKTTDADKSTDKQPASSAPAPSTGA